MTVTRFAPSPTGRLHLGHAWSAMLAHDFARARGGRFLLRIEDIDQARCRDVFVDRIYDDLLWLGLEWDGAVIFQSQRTHLYTAALNQLKQLSVVYRCWCTRAEIAASASAPHGDEGPIYPGTCRGRADPDGDLPYCWRLDVAAATAITGPLSWTDAVAGTVPAMPGHHGDVVIARKDAASSYHLSVTIDDSDQGVSDIVRGRDLFGATHVHRLLQALLGLPTPHYHHHPLILDAEGERLAKRRNAVTIQTLRDSGLSPKEVVEAMRSGRFPFGFAVESA